MKFLIILLVLLNSIFSQSKKVVLGEEEIRKSPAAKFENRNEVFASPIRKVKEQEIGKGLQSEVSVSDSQITKSGFTVQRFYPDDNKLGGDILTINKNADYGHINSIRRILNAYIQSSFEFNEKNAEKIVSQVLYYNAQNRKKIGNISKRYTHTLIESLDKNKVGIGKKFSDWAGNTQIVIPIKSGTKTKEEVLISKDRIKDSKTIKEETKTVKDGKDSKTTKEETKTVKDGKDSKTTKEETKTVKDSKDSKTKNSKLALDEIKSAKDSKKTADDIVDSTSKTSKNAKNSKSIKITEIIGESKTTIKEEKIIIETKVGDEEPKVPNKDNLINEAAKDSKVTNDESKSVKDSPSKIETKSTKDLPTKDVPVKESAKNLPIKDEPKSVKDSKVAKDEGTKNVPPPEKDKEVSKTTTTVANNSSSTSNQSNNSTKTVTSTPPKKEEPPVKIPKTKEEIKRMTEELIKLKEKEKDRVENSDNVVGEKILFLKVKEFLAEGHYVSEMWAVDTDNDDELFPSPFKKVCGKEFKELSTGVVVLCFKENNTSKDSHHLALLDKNDLKLIKQTKEVIFWRTFLKEQNEKIYVVEELDGAYYLSRFSNSLVLEKRSSDPINPDCEIAFMKNKIYMTIKSKDGKDVTIRVLDRESLKLRQQIKKK